MARDDPVDASGAAPAGARPPDSVGRGATDADKGPALSLPAHRMERPGERHLGARARSREPTRRAYPRSSPPAAWRWPPSNRGERVLDPFTGDGRAVVAALDLGAETWAVDPGGAPPRHMGRHAGDGPPARAAGLRPAAGVGFDNKLRGAPMRTRTRAKAIIDATARVDPSAKIEAGAQIGRYAQVGARAIIEKGTTIGTEARIGDDARILGGCRIGEAARIGDEALVEKGCMIGRNVEIGGGSTIEASTVGADARIGKQCEIRSTGIGQRCVIDDEVHTKAGTEINARSRIGQGTTIAGQCTLGEGTVIGERVALEQRATTGPYAYIGDKGLHRGAGRNRREQRELRAKHESRCTRLSPSTHGSVRAPRSDHTTRSATVCESPRKQSRKAS